MHRSRKCSRYRLDLLALEIEVRDEANYAVQLRHEDSFVRQFLGQVQPGFASWAYQYHVRLNGIPIDPEFGQLAKDLRELLCVFVVLPSDSRS